MGAFSLFLLFWVIPPATSIWCFACVDKTFDYNSHLVPLLKIPPLMPNCSPDHSPKRDSEIPSHIWFHQCSNLCLSLDWKRNNQTTDRLRFCSTGLLNEEDFTNKTLEIVKIERYPGLENHLMLCDNDFCNGNEEIDFHNSELLENGTTKSPAIPLATGSPATAVSSKTEVYDPKNPQLIKQISSKVAYRFKRPRSTAAPQIALTIIMLILSYT